MIQTYTLPYVKLIKKQLSDNQKIFLVCFEQKGKELSKNELKLEEEVLNKQNIYLIRFKYSNFGLLVLLKFPFIFIKLLYIIFTNKISHIHTWCTPAGSIGFLLSIITRKKLILDSYEPHAEPMAESNTWKKGSLSFKILFWLEKKQLQRAEKVITCVKSMDIYVKEKFDYDLKNYHTKPACIDFELFDFKKSKNKELLTKYKLIDKIIGVYVGKFGGSYLKDEVFELIKLGEDYWGKNNFRFIILSVHPVEFIREQILKFNINPETIIHLFVSHQEVPKYMGLADFAISAFIPVPSKRYGSPIKNSEYLAMGLPVIIPKNISDDSEIIEKNNFGYVLNDLSENELQKAINHISTLIKDEAVSLKITEYAKQNRNFEIAEKVYEELYGKQLINNPVSGNVLVLTYWSYKDALIQAYTLPYVRLIKNNLTRNQKLFLVTLEQDFFRVSDEEWELEKNKLAKENIHLIKYNYLKFGFKMIFTLMKAFSFLTVKIYTNNIQTIHVWCTPAGALGYILSKTTGKNLIIDSYEPHAESMVENGTWSKDSLKFKLLYWFERKQSNHAKTIIGLTEKTPEYALNKYQAQFKNYFTKPALVELNSIQFEISKYKQLRASQNLENKIVGVYAGKLGGIYLKEEFFDFLKVADDFWGNRLHFYFLTDTNESIINNYISNKKINSCSVITKFVSHKEVNNYLQIADFALNFVNPIPSKRYCTSIKDGEYWAMGLPVVITKNISDDSDIIKTNKIGSVIERLENEGYKNSILEINNLLINNSREELYLKIRPIAEKYRNMELAEKIYKKIYKAKMD